MDILAVGIVEHAARAEEGHDFHHRVDDEMHPRGHQALGCHQGTGEEDVGEVGHSGVGQAVLEVCLLQRHSRAEHQRNDGEAHDHILSPRSPQHIHAESVVDKTDTGESARLDHCHRVQEGRHGGGGNCRCRQPAVHRPNGGLDTAAHEGEGEHRQQHRHVAIEIGEMTTEDEVLCIVDD